MKKTYFVFMVLSLLLLLNSQIIKAENPPVSRNSDAGVSKPQDAGNKVCPVSGEMINEETKATYEYEGKIYNFCCAMCINDFKKDPAKYIKKVEKEMQGQPKEQMHDAQKEPEPGHSH